MKFNIADMPVIPANNGRKVEDVTLEALRTAGEAFLGFGLNKGDVIAFPAAEDMLVKTQEVRAGGPKAHLVSVMRSGKPSWLSTGSVRKRDKDMQYACDASKILGTEYPNDLDRMNFLAGKTITVTDTVNRPTNKFTTDGVRIEGEFVDRPFPIFEITEGTAEATSDGGAA